MARVLAGRLPEGKAEVLVLDLDGVLYLHDQAVPGAGAALHALAGSGLRLLFVTNNATRSRADTAAKIARVVGYRPEPEQVVNAPLAAASVLQRADAPVFLLGARGIEPELSEAGIAVTADHRAASTVVVGLDPDLTYARLRDAALAIEAGARFVATNDDPSYPAPEGRYPGAGSLVAALETATGHRAEVCGKPHAPMRELVRRAAGSDRVVVVGDRPETDLAMAAAEGWSSVLVLTGVVDRPPPDLEPDLVIDSIADLPEALGLQT